MHRITGALAASLFLLAAGPAAALSPTRTLDVTANLKQVARDGLKATHEGQVTARGIGSGKLRLKSEIKKGRITATFNFISGSSEIRGKASGPVSVEGRISYSGSARITSGSGRFRKASGSGLTFSGAGPLSGKTVQVKLRGTLRY